MIRWAFNKLLGFTDELKDGAFYEYCKKVEIGSDNDYFFIIDEINRGDLYQFIALL